MKLLIRYVHKKLSKRAKNKPSKPCSKGKVNESDNIKLSTVSWYFGDLSSPDAESLLEDKPNQSFVVRRSSETEFEYCITYKLEDEIASTRVRRSKNGLLSLNYNEPDQLRATSIRQLILWFQKLAEMDREVCMLNRRGKAIPFKIRHPLQRVCTLQEHCRRAIRLSAPRDSVESLPLPTQLKRYLLAI